MYPSYLNALKDFVEGKKDLREWPAWWQENAHLIEENEGRTGYLKIKLNWQEGARQILEQHGISYKMDETLKWSRCNVCGKPLFHVESGVTTPEQIREFARNSHLPGKEQIEQDGWIHPGVYCPNGCTYMLITFRDDDTY